MLGRIAGWSSAILLVLLILAASYAMQLQGELDSVRNDLRDANHRVEVLESRTDTNSRVRAMPPSKKLEELQQWATP